MEFYSKNKPLINSILTGTVYLLFSWSIDVSAGMQRLFMVVMVFLPGLTFPLTTTYYKTSQIKYNALRSIGHLVLSVLIYYGSVWLYSADGRIRYATILAGFTGSLLYLLSTKFILKKRLNAFQIGFTAILSGLVFFPIELAGSALLVGFPIFLWTIINGQLMNHEYKSY